MKFPSPWLDYFCRNGFDSELKNTWLFQDKIIAQVWQSGISETSQLNYSKPRNWLTAWLANFTYQVQVHFKASDFYSLPACSEGSTLMTWVLFFGAAYPHLQLCSLCALWNVNVLHKTWHGSKDVGNNWLWMNGRKKNLAFRQGNPSRRIIWKHHMQYPRPSLSMGNINEIKGHLCSRERLKKAVFA